MRLQIRQKFDSANADKERLQAAYKSAKADSTTYSEQLRDLKKLIKGMGEAKAKFVKVVNADNIKKIKAILSAN